VSISNIPALTGGGSAVGFARETTWGTPETSGSGATKTFGSVAHPSHFLAVKEETFDPKVNANAQMDDLDQNREISRIIADGNTLDGSIRCNIGRESFGWFMTMLLGNPSTTQTAASSGGSDNDVDQHIWIPGISDGKYPSAGGAPLARSAWPLPFSFESRLDTAKSKLITGALCKRLGFELGNNAAAMLTADFIAKKMQILQGANTAGVVDPSGVAKPCVLTVDPTFMDENIWHWKEIDIGLPKLSNRAGVLTDAACITSIAYDLAFPDLHGIFTGGSGQDIGTYGVDKFQASGRVTMLFEDETLLYMIKDGLYFASEVLLTGDDIQTGSPYSLKFEILSAMAAQAGIPNKVGDLQYDFAWNARRDPTEGSSMRITLVNSVADYSA
jgi:hypothetical protein